MFAMYLRPNENWYERFHHQTRQNRVSSRVAMKWFVVRATESVSSIAGLAHLHHPERSSDRRFSVHEAARLFFILTRLLWVAYCRIGKGTVSLQPAQSRRKNFATTGPRCRHEAQRVPPSWPGTGRHLMGSRPAGFLAAGPRKKTPYPQRRLVGLRCDITVQIVSLR